MKRGMQLRIHCNLKVEPRCVAPVVLGFLAKFVLHIRTNCYFRACGQNSNIKFLTESNNLAIRRRLQLFFFHCTDNNIAFLRPVHLT